MTTPTSSGIGMIMNECLQHRREFLRQILATSLVLNHCLPILPLNTPLTGSETKDKQGRQRIFWATQPLEIKGTPEQEAEWAERQKRADEAIKDMVIVPTYEISGDVDWTVINRLREERADLLEKMSERIREDLDRKVIESWHEHVRGYGIEGLT